MGGKGVVKRRNGMELLNECGNSGEWVGRVGNGEECEVMRGNGREW